MTPKVYYQPVALAVGVAEGAGHAVRRSCNGRKHGGNFDSLATIAPLAAHDGVFRVIEQEGFTERRQAERSLQESWRRLADVMDNIPGGFIALDRHWNVTYINAWAAREVGYETRDLIGKNLWLAFPKALAAGYEPHYRKAMVERVAVRFEARGVVRDHWYENRVFPTPGGIAVFATDITERKALERELQERRMERENLLQQQVAVQTASAIAHELNQPLFAVAANSEAALRMLRAGNPQPDKLMNALEANVRQAQRAGQSTRQLLEFFDKNSSLTEALDLNAEVVNALHTVRSDYEMAFKAALELEKDLPLAQANRVHVQKVLVNLLRNGVEAMEEAGVPAPAITVTVRTLKDKGRAQVSVRDNGPGLTLEDIKRIFQPFYTTKANGIGMGLKISRSLIETNGGELWVDAEEGRGATFHFTLPFAR